MSCYRIGRCALVMLTCAALQACAGYDLGGEQGVAAAPLQSEDTAPRATAIDLSQCLNTDCVAPTDDRPKLGSSEHVCEVDRARSLSLAWSVDYAEATDPGCDPNMGVCGPEPRTVQCEGIGECVISGFAIALAPDRSLWALANISTPEFTGELGGLWLGHYGQDGERISERIVAHDTTDKDQYLYYQGYITLDERGHVYLAVGKQVGKAVDESPFGPHDDAQTSVWLAEYDAAGEPVGGPIPIEGLTLQPWFSSVRPSAAGPGSLVLAQPQLVSGSLVLLATDTHEVSWVQTREGRIGFRSFVNDRQGSVSLLTVSPDEEPSGRVEHYTADGRLAWERTLPWREHRNEFSAADIAIDGDGNLLQTSYRWQEREELWVHKILASGQSAWITAITSPVMEDGAGFSRGYSTMTGSADREGTLFINAGSIQLSDPDGTQGPQNARVYSLSSDGQTCAIYDWPTESTLLAQVIPGDDGALYFASGTGFGRLQR